MITKGAFGYIIGKKKRIMEVQKDADLLWQILVREIYVLLKHFQTRDSMKNAFEKIKTTKCAPKRVDQDKLKMFTDFESTNNNNNDWHNILYYCQSSFINLLEAGYIVNQHEERGKIFILDFNKGKVMYYSKDFDGKSKTIQTATLEEIMEFDEMPMKTYTEIVTEMKANFNEYYEKHSKIEEELKNLMKLKVVSKTQNAVNIEEKVNRLIDEMNWEKKKLNKNRRVFYNRLKVLDLIDETTSD